MNFRTLAIAMMASGSCGVAHGNSIARIETVTVCLDNFNNDRAIDQAEMMADRILQTAAVNISWRRSQTPCAKLAGDAIVIDLLSRAPKDAPSSSLARAFPYEGRHIQVFLDRISDRQGDFPCVLLAHILAHEIAHILEGLVRHSSSGLMKAAWNEADYERMKRLPLTFAREDIELIHAGLAERAAR